MSVAAAEAVLAAALKPPRAHGAPVAEAAMRATPEDFVVEEDLGFAPAGSGAHLLLRVRKRDANTPWVARELARLAGCRPHDVGYAGLKDRRAIAIQWFSVPRPRTAVDLAQGRGEGFEVLEAHPHTRKLPRGALAGNRFTLRLRARTGDGPELADLLGPRLAAVGARGVPNYFGPQRFGREGGNLGGEAQDLARLPAMERSLRLSAARSVVFNALLAERVADGSWERLLAGDLAGLDGRGSIFAVDAPDETLMARCARLEIHPTGPLWGTGEPPTGALVRELEMRIGAGFSAQCALCAAAGMAQERRSLRLRVAELDCQAEPLAVTLRFRLTRGSFATAVLRELVEDAADAVDDSDVLMRAIRAMSAEIASCDFGPSIRGQQHVDRAGPAVRRTCGDVGEHGPGAPQNRAHRGLQHRPAVTGAQALAVHDAHAAHATLERCNQELAQRLLGLGDGESVQIDLALHAILAAAQPADDLHLHAGPLIDQLLATGERRIRRLNGEALLEDRRAVGAREAGARARLRATRRGGACRERLDAAHRGAKQRRLVRIVRIVVAARVSHATSAASH